MKHGCAIVVAAGLLCVGVSARAQSLADLARQEQERRKSVKEPARVYTDADVDKTAPLTTAAARPAPAASGDATKDAAAAPAGAEPQGAKDGNKEKQAPKDEAGWRSRMQQARDDVARSQRLLTAMEQQLISMGIQASSAAIAGRPAPDSAKQEETAREVERLRADVTKATATLSRLEDEARSSGIPPGWVR